jgi:hypothetical protein
LGTVLLAIPRLPDIRLTPVLNGILGTFAFSDVNSELQGWPLAYGRSKLTEILLAREETPL